MDGDSEFSIFEELIYDSDEVVWEVKFDELEKQTIMPYNIKCSLDVQENTCSVELDVEAFGDCVIYSNFTCDIAVSDTNCISPYDTANDLGSTAPPTTEPSKGGQPPALGIPNLWACHGTSRNLYAGSYITEQWPSSTPSPSNDHFDTADQNVSLI
ncbi:hypothetical protein AVEN_85676-1 [Araneus ventricosus]|uniref:Uncharacterized protein n=1 Tax=Araneus ventricosus TaxID=182803 RepID=A0A4Y2QR63_ARAVE|nr:hypothetical protein AVEN_85676-1 [Araneus ventricosus]